MTADTQKHHLIAAAVVWQEEKILLVEQQGLGDTESAWALPGGRAEPGELLHETLAREMREETGLEVTRLGELLYLVQIDNPNSQQIIENLGSGEGYQSTAVVYEVARWQGVLKPADPDGFILDARFWAVEEAVALIEQTLHFRIMREPLLAYLRGEAGAGSTWYYRRQPDNQDKLLFSSKIN